METRNRIVAFQGLEAGEMGSRCLIGTEFEFCKMKRVLGVDGGDGCTTT